MRLNRGFVNSCCKQGRNWTLVNSITSLPNYTGLQFCQKKHYSSTRSPQQRPSVIMLFSNILIFNVILRPCMGTEFNSMIIYVSVNNDQMNFLFAKQFQKHFRFNNDQNFLFVKQFQKHFRFITKLKSFQDVTISYFKQ